MEDAEREDAPSEVVRLTLRGAGQATSTACASKARSPFGGVSRERGAEKELEPEKEQTELRPPRLKMETGTLAARDCGRTPSMLARTLCWVAVTARVRAMASPGCSSRQCAMRALWLLLAFGLSRAKVRGSSAPGERNEQENGVAKVSRSVQGLHPRKLK